MDIPLIGQSAAKKEERAQKMNAGRQCKTHDGCEDNRLGNVICTATYNLEMGGSATTPASDYEA
jgi:hypothetical protein